MRNVIAWWIFCGSLVLGVLFDILFNGHGPGLNVPIAIGVLLVCFELIRWRLAVPFRVEARLLLWSALLFAGFIAIRDSLVLILMDVAAILVVRLMASVKSRNGSFLSSAVTEYFVAALPVWLETGFGFLPLIANEIHWHDMSKSTIRRAVAAAAIGILIALPILYLFGSLLCSADSEFNQLITRTFNWNFPAIWSHTILSVLFAAVACGVLKVLFMWDNSKQPSERPQWLKPAGVELNVVLSLVNVLFLAFVVVQFHFLFGTYHQIMLSSGMTYKEYARSGFFSLLWVTALVMPMLLAFHWFAQSSTRSTYLVFRLLCLSLVLQLFVIMLSAFHRINLYVEAYGLTQLRFYSVMFMVWLAIVFVWFIATVLMDKRDRFIFGAAISALGMVMLLNIINPDASIVRYNRLHIPSQSGFDVDYAESLSADAVPELMECERLNRDQDDRQSLANYLETNYGKNVPSDLRSWNWDKSNALALVASNVKALTKDANTEPSDSDCGCGNTSTSIETKAK